MSGHRPRARLLALTAALAAPALYSRWIRPRLLTWGATRDETTRAYPGDELVPNPDGGATMATTLPAPPERVWPWLVQMGLGRGGWYSWDWLDNDGQSSADRIVPQWQSLEVGQHLYRAPKGPTNWWTVVVLEPNRTLVLQTSYGLTGQGFDPRFGPVPWAYVDGIWGFHLRPAPSGRTRLVVRTRSRSRPRPLARPFGLLLGGTAALQHADPPVPQPARSGRCGGVTHTTEAHCRGVRCRPSGIPAVCGGCHGH
jgi:hypothetical protein